MRGAIGISVAFHLALVTAAWTGLPVLFEDDLLEETPIIIELVTIADETRAAPEVVRQEAPEPEPEPVKPQPVKAEPKPPPPPAAKPAPPAPEKVAALPPPPKPEPAPKAVEPPPPAAGNARRTGTARAEAPPGQCAPADQARTARENATV